MCSNINHNLSLAIKIPTITVHSESLVTAINKTLSKFYAEELYKDYLNLHDVHKSLFNKNGSTAKIQSERVILCEINAGLWAKAFKSAINSLTENTYPHFTITQNFIIYLLNANSDTDLGLTEEYFYKLLITFPPGPQSFDYYWPIVSEPLLLANINNAGDSSLFFWLLDTLTICLKSHKVSSVDLNNRPGSKSLRTYNSSKVMSVYSEEKILEVLDNFNGINLNQSLIERQKEKPNAFFDLSWDGKIKNVLLALSFLYDILETDFGFWLSSGNFSQEKQPLLSCLFWENERDFGLNTKVQKIINLYKLVLQSPYKCEKLFVVKKFVNLLAEVMRCRDITEGIKYPFFGMHSHNIARQISHILLEHLQELQSKNKFSKNYLLVNLNPSWLRLLLCSHLLSALTGYQCLPELTGVYDILETVAFANEDGAKNSFKRGRIKKISKSSELIQQINNQQSINSKVKNGKTLLHVACEENDVKKVRALLTFPELDVNATDREGWTALHLAAFRGNSSCVEELLNFDPKPGDVQKPLNTRALGPKSTTPLMCAVSAGKVAVCQLLLKHTGSVLLEDFNELNQTAIELSHEPEVTRVLKHYMDNYVWTWNSQKNISFDLHLKETIVRLCVEMMQAYFSTHRTWDVYRALKKSENLDGDSFESVNSKIKCKWDYMRYQRDIKRNIHKLRRLVPKLEKVPEFRSSHQIYIRLLTFNKT